MGGRGSKIDDRRNWEFYRVDGKVKRLTSKEGKLMQGFPDYFSFLVSEVQAMKQLGNSVAISAIQSVAESMIEYMEFKKSSQKIKDSKALIIQHKQRVKN